MSIYGSDSDDYEYDNEEAEEIFQEERIGRARYRSLLYKEYERLENTHVNVTIDEDDSSPYVYIFSEEDTDVGLLDGVGGLFNMKRINKKDLKYRRDLINILTYSYLMILNRSFFSRNKESNSRLDSEMIESLKSTCLEDMNMSSALCLKLNSTVFQEQWKDFKFFLTIKYMNMKNDKFMRILRNELQDTYTKEYTEFLLSKARFLYKNYYEIENVNQLHGLVSNFREDILKQKPIDFTKNAYHQTFYSQVKSALEYQKQQHRNAFINFTNITSLPYFLDNWTDKHNELYKDFLGRTNSISVIEITNQYNVNYTSTRRIPTELQNKTKTMKDNVLENLKTLFSQLIVEVTRTCLAFKRISLILRNLSINKYLEPILNLIDATGCNFISFKSDKSCEVIIQTTLNNILYFSVPFPVFPTRKFINRDVCFLNLYESSTVYPNEINILYKEVRTINAEKFENDFTLDDYNIFLLNYYSRLNDVQIQNLDQWCKKTRLIKSKIYASSRYIRVIAVNRIKSFYRLFVKGNNNKEKLLLKKKEEQDRLDERLREEEELLNAYIKQNEIEKRERKIHSEAVTFIEKSDNKINTSNIKYSPKNLSINKHKISIPDKMNNNKRWFGFNRNDQLINLVISVGSLVNVMDIKTYYTMEEIIEVIETVGKICMITKSRQFVKLCRILSGKHKAEKTLESFIEGFCWMYENLTVWKVLKMASYFCGSTNNSKWYTYLINNTNKIAKFCN